MCFSNPNVNDHRLIVGTDVEIMGEGIQPSMTTVMPDVKGLNAIMYMLFAPKVGFTRPRFTLSNL